MKKRHDKTESSPVKEVIRDVLRYDVWLKVLTSSSLGLIIAGFCVPPIGIIDGSVLTGTGILAGFGALFEGGHAIDRGMDVKLKIADAELQIENDELEKEKLGNLNDGEINIEE